jgi:hypothetical protein
VSYHQIRLHRPHANNQCFLTRAKRVCAYAIMIYHYHIHFVPEMYKTCILLFAIHMASSLLALKSSVIVVTCDVRTIASLSLSNMHLLHWSS